MGDTNERYIDEIVSLRSSIEQGEGDPTPTRPRPRTAPLDAALRLARTDWILTSPEIIEGRFAGGLRGGVIPMHLVMRGPYRGWGEPLAPHCSANKLQPARREEPTPAPHKEFQYDPLDNGIGKSSGRSLIPEAPIDATDR